MNAITRISPRTVRPGATRLPEARPIAPFYCTPLVHPEAKISRRFLGVTQGILEGKIKIENNPDSAEFFSADTKGGTTIVRGRLGEAFEQIREMNGMPMETVVEFRGLGQPKRWTLREIWYAGVVAEIHEAAHLAQIGKCPHASLLFPGQHRLGERLRRERAMIPQEAKFTRALDLVYERFWWEVGANAVAGTPGGRAENAVINHVFASCQVFIDMVLKVFDSETAACGFNSVRDSASALINYMHWWTGLTAAERLTVCGESAHIDQINPA